MALSQNTIWELRYNGSDSNGGGFNPTNANFPTDLAATSANTSSPVVTSATYSFVSSDVGYMVFIKSGTNWTPGWYTIASVAAGAATLNAAIGSVVLYGSAGVNSSVGCGTSATLSSGTWGLDYSQNSTARFSFTDINIQSTTTNFVSTNNPVTKSMVGNILNITNMSEFAEISSVSGTTATCSQSLGSQSVAPTLIGYWAMNEGTGTTTADGSGNGKTATFSANAPTWNSSVSSTIQFADAYCLSFTASSNTYATIAANYALTTSSALTYSLWAYIPSTSDKGCMFSDSPSDSSGLGIGVGSGTYDSYGNHFVICCWGSNWYDTGVNIGTGWHHMLCTVSSSGQVKCYLDGTYIYTASGNIVRISSSSTSYIGTCSEANRQFTGRLDDIRIYSSLLSQSQITALASGTTPGTSYGVGAIGGALFSLSGSINIGVAGNKYFMQAGSGYTYTATYSASATASGVSASTPYNKLSGYTTYRGDGGQATITLSTNSNLSGINITTGGWWIENLVINCASLSGSTGISASAGNLYIRNCKIQNFTSSGINTNSNTPLIVDSCELTGGTSAATGAIKAANNCVIYNNYIHGNACSGIYQTGGGITVLYCIIANNSGASSDGIYINGACAILECTIYNNGRHGINNAFTGYVALLIKNNLLISNGGYGIVGDVSAGVPAMRQFDGNAYYGNTSGTRSNMNDLTTNPINGVAPYTNVLDVILTSSPLNNPAGNDFSLNTAAGGGLACTGYGSPATAPGLATPVSYPSFGFYQPSTTSSGSAGILRSPGMNGGING